MGLVTHTPYKGVKLTDSGRRVALEVLRHHRLLELYLAESLGVPWDRVHDEAEVLEHVLSEELEELIAAKLGNPTRDPHGDPIPSRRAGDRGAARPSASPSWSRARAGCSCACRTPTRACCATWRSSASPPASASRSSTASRSAVRCSRASTARCSVLGGQLAAAMRVEVDVRDEERTVELIRWAEGLMLRFDEALVPAEDVSCVDAPLATKRRVGARRRRAIGAGVGGSAPMTRCCSSADCGAWQVQHARQPWATRQAYACDRDLRWSRVTSADPARRRTPTYPFAHPPVFFTRRSLGQRGSSARPSTVVRRATHGSDAAATPPSTRMLIPLT